MVIQKILKNILLPVLIIFFAAGALYAVTQDNGPLKGSETVSVDNLRKVCKADLDFFKDQLSKLSANAKNKSDKHFAKWFDDGYKEAVELVDEVNDLDDCFFALNYYANGFDERNITVRPNFKMPPQQYPGFLTSLVDGRHKVIYKHPGLEHLGELKVGDEVVMVNQMDIEEYYDDFVKPFYSSNESDFSLQASAVHNFIEDGNKFKPVPLTATFEDQEKSFSLELKYTNLTNQAARIAEKLTRPSLTKFKVESIGGGVWLRIPTFFPNQEEAVVFNGLLSTIHKFGQQEFIVFDLRGNLGGKNDLQRALVRNLYGDKYLKSLGKKHVYNEPKIIKVRLSKLEQNIFKQTASKGEIKQFARELKKGMDYHDIKKNIYDDKTYLYTNTHEKELRAQVVVLTDKFCSGACWDMVRELRQIPGVRHFGSATNIETQYFSGVKLTLPSEHFEMFTPTRMVASPSMGYGMAHRPNKVFDGDFYNDAQIMDWVLTEIDD